MGSIETLPKIGQYEFREGVNDILLDEAKSFAQIKERVSIALKNLDADSSNQLLNPIYGTPILWDVYVNRRTINGFRDSGAVQHVPEPGSLVIWSSASLVAVHRRRHS